ncbi:MAG: Glu-tRNA(Gln) amidotransferase subunit GatE [Candidatus Micrarchaeota archaeon]|nr:Glu-tRNA(Gln) amidotransferase subunit GatE [Candidatus Micrarchaeota archaeon]
MVKIGIEIHQRIDTNKLFCNCSSTISDSAIPNSIISRKLHPVLSELGEFDKAALAEYQKNRIYEYQLFDKNTCLVETDEEPPHSMNSDALMIALQISMHLNCKLVDEVHIMRKMVIDGSNTSGFQRTSVIAMGGYIETSKGKVSITQIAIEEESSGIVENKESKVIYRLDRLGIPLIEITTDPDIKDAQHLVEVAEKIGLLLRATGKVARGLGTIRQDVNISTEDGARVEIKGAQDLKLLPTLMETEVKRQKELIKISGELKTKFNGKITIQRIFVNITNVFVNTQAPMVKNGIANGEVVYGLRLQHLKGILGRELQPNKRYGTELSDYAKTAGVKGIIHSDETLEKYGFAEQETSSLRKTLNIGDNDAFVLVIAKEDVAKRALENVAKRCEMDFVPEETRKANPDGTTNYMRPLAGKARMYPETDVPPIAIDAKLLKEVKENKSESLDEKKEKLAKILNKEMAESMLRSKNLQLFEKLLSLDVDPVLIANTLENTVVSLRREGIVISDLEMVMIDLFTNYKKGLFVKAAIIEILKHVSKGMPVGEAVEKNNLGKLSGAELQKIAQENNFDIAKIMQKYRLRIEPSDVAKLKKN